MAVITEDAIRELAGFHGELAPVTSCYLDVDGRRLVRHQDCVHELDLLLKSARDKANGSASVASDLRQIEDYVKSGFDRSTTRGLAFFACSAHDLFRVIPLPVAVHNRIIVNASPAVGQLKSVVQDYERFGVLLADKQRARMFVFELGVLTDHSELFDELPRDYDSRGHGDQGHARERHHVDELAAQHVRHAAQVAFDVYQRSGFEHFTVGGSDIAHEIEAVLHPYLRERQCGSIGVGANASVDEIRQAALELEAEIDRAREAQWVERLRDAVGSNNKACAGLEPVLQALHEHRVERLLVSDGFNSAGWHCGACGALAAVGRACTSCGDPAMTQIEDMVEDAIEQALVQGVSVDICIGNADLDVLGRIGALLRY